MQQTPTVLTHLTKHKSLTQAEAGTVYRIRALPRRIADLKAAGYSIRSEHKKDATGQRYVRYYLESEVASEVEAPAQETQTTPDLTLRIGARIRVVDPWMATAYSKGDEGVVQYGLEDEEGQFNGRGFYVKFEGKARERYVTANEVEVIA